MVCFQPFWIPGLEFRCVPDHDRLPLSFPTEAVVIRVEYNGDACEGHSYRKIWMWNDLIGMCSLDICFYFVLAGIVYFPLHVGGPVQIGDRARCSATYTTDYCDGRGGEVRCVSVVLIIIISYLHDVPWTTRAVILSGRANRPSVCDLLHTVDGCKVCVLIF